MTMPHHTGSVLMRAVTRRFRPLFLLLLLVPSIASTQTIPPIPGMSGTASKEKQAAPAAPGVAESPGAVRTKLLEKLAAARAELDRADSAEVQAAAARAGETERGQLRRRILLDLNVRNVEKEISQFDKLEAVKRSRAGLTRSIAEWTGFPTPPPYSVLLIDELRKQAQTAAVRVETIELRSALQVQQMDNLRDDLKKSETRLRQLQDKMEKAKTPEERDALAWQKQTEELASRTVAAGIAATEAARLTTEEETVTAREELAFLERKLTLAEQHTSFTRKDLEEKLAQLAARQNDTEKELARALRANAAERKALETLEGELSRRGPAAGGGGEKGGDRLEQQLALQRILVENGTIRAEGLRSLLDYLKMQSAFWEFRHSFAASGDAAVKQRFSTKIADVQKELALTENYLRQQLKLTLRQVDEQEGKVPFVQSAAEGEQLQKVIAAYRTRDQIYLAQMANILETKELFERWQARFDEELKKSFAAKTGNWLSKLKSIAKAAWLYEIFTIEDTIEVEGKKITGTRGITVGKITSALLILIGGYLVSSFLTRLAERAAVRYFTVNPVNARIARGWTLGLLTIILVAVSLVSVKIPLTIFAFLGGAIAIGLGFGMQTLLKNLMSGIMLLTERPFRVGDIVEVDGIRGRITDIGIRAATISDVNGIDTLIPNSTFIERNVTNWTLTNPKVRFNIKVGVAYNSPTRQVAELLMEVAERHGLVEKEPRPEVILEEFGSDALNFGLYYWLRITPETNSRLVASDLRFMVEQSLAKHGIAIAYPQRDVHLDSVKPIQVQVVSEKEAGPP